MKIQEYCFQLYVFGCLSLIAIGCAIIVVDQYHWSHISMQAPLLVERLIGDDDKHGGN